MRDRNIAEGECVPGNYIDLLRGPIKGGSLFALLAKVLLLAFNVVYSISA